MHIYIDIYIYLYLDIDIYIDIHVNIHMPRSLVKGTGLFSISEMAAWKLRRCDPETLSPKEGLAFPREPNTP